jgi:L-amino acid N-acyltransferase YncA
MRTVLIRAAAEGDMICVAQIYRGYVRNSYASFELEPPSVEDMLTRWRGICGRGLPYLVATREDVVVGYAHATPYGSRPSCRASVEDSVYVHTNFVRQGVGSALLLALLDECKSAGLRQMIAVIHGKNRPSIALHVKRGFATVGLLSDLGTKGGQSFDAVLMQRSLVSL